MPKTRIELDCGNLSPFISGSDFASIFSEVKRAHELLIDRSGEGGASLGWLDLPDDTPDELIRDIENCAGEVRETSEVLVVIGIGGSYLGSRAALEFCRPKGLKVVFAGINLDADYLQDVLDGLKGRDVCVNVISKSGATLEPAAAFRVIYNYMKKRYSSRQLKKRIICTTDRQKGTLKKIADSEGFREFFIPQDVEGRFSVLTPVGLLPQAASGIDIRELLRGGSDMKDLCSALDLEKNISYRYAAARQLLYRKGKNIEILSGFNPCLYYLAEWWRQLFAESEGKQGKGIFPASCVLTTDLHSIGQMIQEGARNLFETFMAVEKPRREIKVPAMDKNIDGLDYIKGKGFSFINNQAYVGTRKAHMDGGVPNMSIKVADRSAYSLGSLFFFFEKAVAISAYIQGVNPFNQPGVEAYKKNMFALLGRND